MTTLTTLSSRIVAAASAFALSLVLFTSTVAVPQNAFAGTTYVGAVV